MATGVLPELGRTTRSSPTYREHGHALVRGVPMRSLMAEMFGRVEGCSHGRGGSMHLFDVSRRFYGGQAIVGAGLAHSDRPRARRPACSAAPDG